MNRRAMLTAAPILAASCLIAIPARPALARAGDTPVMMLAREWQAYSTWVNGPETNGATEAEFDLLTDKLNIFVAEIVATPSESERDTAIKLFVLMQEFQPCSFVDGFAALLQEAKQLIPSDKAPLAFHSINAQMA